MSTFIMLTRVSPEALRSPKGVEVEWTRYKEMVRELPEIGTVIAVS